MLVAEEYGKNVHKKIQKMSRKTVFIIGAGASEEANLPTGYELKRKIAELLDMRFDSFGSRLESGDYAIVEALRSYVQQPNGHRGDINPFLYEAWHIRDALPQAISIDNFIDTQDNDKIALCGKLAIVISILDAEKNSLLYFDRLGSNSTINFDSLEKTWYIPFFQLLTENCKKNDIKERFKSITLIIFNYDRCVEHFIYHRLINYYRLSDVEAADLVNNINIYHPYGEVGTLPWINQNGAVEFGLKPHPEQLLNLADQIKTFTEGTNPESSEILKIRKHMGEATKLVFMGFAFHKLNMELIAPEHNKDDHHIEINCFATTLGVSDSDKEVINDQINKLCHREVRVRMANLKCSAFFVEFWRSLAF
tara:strand:- start:662 stop:1759 length:1098 start_codon:yes stop_codon:yes gene_type:complete